MQKKIRNLLRIVITFECVAVFAITSGMLWMRNPLIYLEWTLSGAWLIAFISINYRLYFNKEDK